MKKLAMPCLLAGLLFILLASPVEAGVTLNLQGERAGTKPPKKSLIGPIKDESHEDTCGCRFGYPSKPNRSFPGYLFLTSYDIETAWMNIDGEDVKLRLAHTTELKRARVGGRFSSIYVASGIKVLIVYTITSLCIPYSPNCEMVGYKARVNVSKGARRQSLRLEGACGCY
jgi:hypothetical protein